MWGAIGLIVSALIAAYMAKKQQEEQRELLRQQNLDANKMRQLPIQPYMEQIEGTTKTDPNPMAVGYLQRLTAGAENAIGNANSMLGY